MAYVGGAMFAFGADHVATGVMGACTGQRQSTQFMQFAEYAGINENVAAAFDLSLSLFAAPIAGGAGFLTNRWGMFGREEIPKIGLTSRLNRSQIRDYLANIHDIPRDQLIRDIESIGLKLRGESPNGLFKPFEDKMGNLRIKIHPSDSMTDYSHVHLYDKSGTSLTPNLTRAPNNSPEVHIRIQSIAEELQWKLRR